MQVHADNWKSKDGLLIWQWIVKLNCCKMMMMCESVLLLLCFPLNSIYFLAEKRLILELCHRVDGDKVSWVPTTKKVFAIFLKTISSKTKNVYANILKTISSKTKNVFVIFLNTIFQKPRKYSSKVFLHYHQECIWSSLKNDFFNLSTIFVCSGVLASCCLWSHGSS